MITELDITTALSNALAASNIPNNVDATIIETQRALETAQAFKAQPVPVPDPVPEPQAIEEPVIFDGPVGVTSAGLYDTWSPWRNTDGTGDWVDKSGVWNGRDAFASWPTVVGEFRGAISPEHFAKGGKLVQLALKAAAGTVVRIACREAADAATWPYLSVLYTDGTTDTLGCTADTVANKTSGYNLGKSPSLDISDQSTCYLAFKAPAKEISTAILVLRVLLSAAITPGKKPGLELYKVVAPWLAPEDSIATLEGDTGLMFTSDHFGPEEFPHLWTPQGNIVDNYREVDTDRGKALEVWFDPRRQGVMDARVPFYGEAHEAAFEYDLKILPTFWPSQGGKMPGFMSRTMRDDPKREGYYGTLKNGNGGRKVDGTDGWSLRGGHGWRLDPNHPLADQVAIDTYAYHADMKMLYGDSWAWTRSSPKSATLGKWHRIYQRLKINTPGVRDGVLEVRIDGHLAFLKTDVYLRSISPWTNVNWYDAVTRQVLNTETEGAIGAIWFNLFHGGTQFPPSRFAAFHMRNVKVKKIS